MNRQSVTGFALIGIILLVFSWYNTKQFERQQQERMRLDSIARVEAALSVAEDAAVVDSSVLDELSVPDSIAEAFNLYKNEYLAVAASKGSSEVVYLENDKIKVGITSKGAQPYNVLVKDYFKHDSTALYLLNSQASSLDMEFDAGQWLNSTDFDYTVVASSASEAVLRLYFDEDSYIENAYHLSAESYMMDMDVRFVGMDSYIPRSSSAFKMTWTADIPRLEKGYDNEKNYSALGYRYMGSDDVKSISLRKDGGRESLAGQTQWVAFKQQFFSAILIADEGFAGGDVGIKAYAQNDPSKRLMAAQAILNVDYDQKSKDFAKSFKFYLGPNHYPVLKSYDCKFDKLLPLGGWLIGSICKYVIIPIFNWLSKSIASYGLIILILTLIIKLAIFPLTYKSYSSSAKMKVLKPEIDKINAKYAKESEAMKRQQATMDLYKKSGVSMFGGCLPVLLQFPILYAMFRFFPASFELRQQGFLWATDLSAYDSILDFGFRIPLYGDHISLFALLMGVSMFIYSKMTVDSNGSNPQMAGMNFMTVWFMPIFMVIICNNFSAGLSYYYMLSNIITIFQNWAIRKWGVNEEALLAKIKEKSATASAPKKSKFQQRLEEAYKIQQQQQKNAKK